MIGLSVSDHHRIIFRKEVECIRIWQDLEKEERAYHDYFNYIKLSFVEKLESFLTDIQYSGWIYSGKSVLLRTAIGKKSN